MQYTANTLENHWMPFTANRNFKENPRLFESASGMYYTNNHGDKVLDGAAGLFCVTAGHARPEIVDAVAKQLATLDYSPPFQFGHPASFEFATKVTRLLPDSINHIFFGNSGSEAVDSALKIVMAYHRAKGDGRRTRFVGREKSYHGVNYGGISVAGLVKNREAFGMGLPGVVHLRHTWLPENRYTKGQPEHGAELADDLQRFCDLHGAENMACCIVEPVVGAAGVLVPPKGYLERLREICTANGILLIFDEVITGFGRTGKGFATETFGVIPDMMTLAKGLTNGVVPMGAVAVSDEIYDSIIDSAADGATTELFHGYTYSASPVACAAGLAALGIYEKEGLFERTGKLSPYFLDAVWSLQGMDVIDDLRGHGLLAGIELKPHPAPSVRGYEALQRLYEKGLLVKVTGDCILLSPPLVISESEIDFMIDTLREVLGTV